MNSLHTDPIPNGTRFVALYGDGSGAKLCKMVLGMLVDHYGDRIPSNAEGLTERGWDLWLPLPETFRLWFEQKAGGE